MADAHKNFAQSLVATAPSPATSGTSLVVTAADGTKFPAAPFNATIWPAGAQPTTANAEIVRVTARSTDTLTIVRAQESTSARTVVVGDQIAATITAKTLTDVETGVSSTTNKARVALANGSVNVTSATWTKVPLDSESYDPGSNYDNATNFRYVAPEAGYYDVYAAVSFNTMSTGARCIVAIYKNGSEYSTVENNSGGTTQSGSSIADIIPLAASDYLEIWVYQATGSTQSILTSGRTFAAFHIKSV